MKLKIIVIIYMIVMIAVFQKIINYEYKQLITEIQKPKAEISVPKPKIWKTAKLTMYNVGDVAQTDDTPCIGASGDDLCKMIAQGINVCAFNKLPLRTKVFIKGQGECIVLDRTAKRYSDRIDWALPKDQKQKALNWGIRNIEYSIIK